MTNDTVYRMFVGMRAGRGGYEGIKPIRCVALQGIRNQLSSVTRGTAKLY